MAPVSKSILARTDPANTQWRHGLSVSLDRVGDAELSRGNAEAALAMEPGFYFAYRALYTASIAREDVAGMHDSIRRMMAADPRRRQIYAIRNSVAPP